MVGGWYDFGPCTSLFGLRRGIILLSLHAVGSSPVSHDLLINFENMNLFLSGSCLSFIMKNVLATAEEFFLSFRSILSSLMEKNALSGWSLSSPAFSSKSLFMCIS